MESIRLLIVDNHRLVRQGLVSLLRTEPSFEVVAEAESVEEALNLLALTRPDVALVDLSFPRLSGREAIAALLLRQPKLGIVVVTASADSADLLGAIQAGARGYVLKNANVDTLFDVVRRVHRGSAGLDSDMAPQVFEILRRSTPPRSLDSVLTPREQEVLDLLLTGADNAKIADRLIISENTVKTHVAHIFEKLGVKNRTSLLTWAAQGGRVNQTPV